MAMDPRFSGAVIVFRPWIFLMNFAALTLLPIFELGVERMGCGSRKMPQNLPFVASILGLRWPIFSLESRVWSGSQDRTGGQGGVWRQGCTSSARMVYFGFQVKRQLEPVLIGLV